MRTRRGESKYLVAIIVGIVVITVVFGIIIVDIVVIVVHFSIRDWK